MPEQHVASMALADRIGELALEKKASDVKILDVHELTSITDVFVVCSGNSDVQVKAITDHILDELAPEEKPLNKEGYDTREWVLLDYVNVVVHVFHDSAREFYNLERLWPDAPSKKLADDSAANPDVPLFEDL